MKFLFIKNHGRTLALTAVIVPLLALFVYVALRSGPLASVAVTVVPVQSAVITPGLFGIGTVQARYTYKIGPTVAGRIKRLDVHVGDEVKAGQVLGEMEPVDLDDRVRSQEAALARVQAALREATARQGYTKAQIQRYEMLLSVRSASEEVTAAKRQEWQIAEAALSGVQQDLARAKSDREAVVAQRSNLRFMAPVGGLVVLRDADPGTTVVAGQSVLEVIDPHHLWLHVRFDQISALGLAAGLPARISLRSRSKQQTLQGHVLRAEPKADSVTEEILAKITFDAAPEVLPPLGELAEVTVDLPALPATPVILNAAVRREGAKIGVWKITEGRLDFVPIQLGIADLEGRVQVLKGLVEGDRIVMFSEKALTANTRIHVVERIAGVAP